MKTFRSILNEMASKIEKRLEDMYDDEPEELNYMVRCWIETGMNATLLDDIQEAYEDIRLDDDLYFDNYDDAVAFLRTLSLPISKCIDIVVEERYTPDEINAISLANVLVDYKASACFDASMPLNKENLANLVARRLAYEYDIIDKI